MNLFSISQLQDYSGIKAHTIRIWEQRYNALKPFRSEGNTRYYDGSQLRRLLNIVSLMNSDYKISELCKMSDNDLNNLLDKKYAEIHTDHPDSEYFISQLISSAIEFDEIRFEKIFSNCILRFGLKNTYIKIIYPALIRLGLMWSKDSLPPAREHFITNLIRLKILTAIDALPLVQENKESWLLFLPEDEFHESGLLLAYFLIRQSGRKVIYLGANLPAESIIDAVKKINPPHVLTFLVSKKDKKREFKLINELSKIINPAKVYISCSVSSLEEFQETRHFMPLHSVEELENLLQ